MEREQWLRAQSERLMSLPGLVTYRARSPYLATRATARYCRDIQGRRMNCCSSSSLRLPKKAKRISQNVELLLYKRLTDRWVIEEFMYPTCWGLHVQPTPLAWRYNKTKSLQPLRCLTAASDVVKSHGEEPESYCKYMWKLLWALITT